MEHDPIMQMCINMVYAALGIVPLDLTRRDAARCAERLSAEEQRKMRRKFRKIWRRQLHSTSGDRIYEAYSDMLGAGKQPDRDQRMARKQAVHSYIMKAAHQLYVSLTAGRNNPENPDGVTGT
jgi:hypothetical protein